MDELFGGVMQRLMLEWTEDECGMRLILYVDLSDMLMRCSGF